jgi:hypothetical protein
MNKTLFIEYYHKRNISQPLIDQALLALQSANDFLSKQGSSLDTATIEQIRTLLDLWIQDSTNDTESILALARYFYLTGHNDQYVYFTRLTGGMGVIENIKERFDLVMAPLKADEAIPINTPPLGSNPEEVPDFTAKFMTKLETIADEKQTRAILCGNNHGLSKEAFSKEKALYDASLSMEAYLKDLHERRVRELQDHSDQDKVWFEQKITQATVDFVASNQELLSAVLKDDVLYLTKIPYDPQAYLEETDPIKKRYYACHCPFAREAILKGEPHISKNWCYCSAGFEKFHFETILDRPLDIEVLQSALQGDPICRFAIKLK